MEENRTHQKVLYMNLGTKRLRGRPRNRWQDEVREDGRLVGGKGSSHKSNPSSVLWDIMDSYSSLLWVTWEVVTFVEGIP